MPYRPAPSKPARPTGVGSFRPGNLCRGGIVREMPRGDKPLIFAGIKPYAILARLLLIEDEHPDRALMTDAIPVVPHLAHGKHNMASEAFEALRTARADGIAPKGGELTFSDFIDTINPLQHIPVVAQIYRHLTGDTISPAARVAGGALYGGPIGLVASVLDAAVAETTGSDIGEHAFAALTGDDAGTQVAAGTAAGSEAAAPVAAAAAPQKLASAGGPETTASIVAPAAASAPVKDVPKPMPQLSPDAFNALISSFADPAAAKAANPQLASATPSASKPVSLAPKATPPAGEQKPGKPPVDLVSAMQANLDQLEAMKRANPDLPVASAFAPSDTAGF